MCLCIRIRLNMSMPTSITAALRQLKAASEAAGASTNTLCSFQHVIIALLKDLYYRFFQRQRAIEGIQRQNSCTSEPGLVSPRHLAVMDGAKEESGNGTKKRKIDSVAPNLILKFTLTGHTKTVTVAKYSPDGNWIATACKSHQYHCQAFPHLSASQLRIS